jgi:hypothetical protein
LYAVNARCSRLQLVDLIRIVDFDISSKKVETWNRYVHASHKTLTNIMKGSDPRRYPSGSSKCISKGKEGIPETQI